MALHALVHCGIGISNFESGVMTMTKKGLTYADAGVDIDAGNTLVERIKPAAKRTSRSGVMSGLGGFGALFEVPKRYKEREK